MPTPKRYKDEAERKRAYRARKKAEAEAEAAKAAGDPDVPDVPSGDAPASPGMAPVFDSDPTRAVLEAIRDNPNAHDSDRIRASQELTRMSTAEAFQAPPQSDLVALRAVLETLPVTERIAYLKGEVDAHRAAGAYQNEQKEDA